MVCSTSEKTVGGKNRPALGQRARAGPAAGALGVARGREVDDLVELRPGVDRADVGVLVQRIAHPQRGDARPQQLHQLVGDRLLHEQPGARAAHVALVEEDPLDDALDGLVQRRVVVHDVGRLAAELQGEPLAGARERALDLLPDVGGAGERHLRHAGVGHHRGADVARAGQHVEHARGQPGLGGDLGEHQRGERGGLGGLEHDRVAGGERRGDLPRGHEQREVPRDHRADHAERLR
jgi:hypothetical protein